MFFNKLNAAALSIDAISNVKGGHKDQPQGGTTTDSGSDYRKDHNSGTTTDSGSDYGKIGKKG